MDELALSTTTSTWRTRAVAVLDESTHAEPRAPPRCARRQGTGGDPLSGTSLPWHARAVVHQGFRVVVVGRVVGGIPRLQWRNRCNCRRRRVGCPEHVAKPRADVVVHEHFDADRGGSRPHPAGWRKSTSPLLVTLRRMTRSPNTRASRSIQGLQPSRCRHTPRLTSRSTRYLTWAKKTHS